MINQKKAIIIGAGPSGLSAALEMCRNGLNPIILEQGDHVGGLMHSPTWNDFTIDIGRKELYSRIPVVSSLWEEFLGDEYQSYPHRVGSLYKGRIIEGSRVHRGLFRGVPFHWLMLGGLSLMKAWVRSSMVSPKTYEDYWHARTGSFFARIFAQGYWEKFRGVPWCEMPVPDKVQTHSINVIKQAMKLESKGGNISQKNWRHPRFGSGQIFELIAKDIQSTGGDIQFGAKVTKITLNADGTLDLEINQQGKLETMCAQNLVSSLPIEGLTELLVSATDDVKMKLSVDPWDKPEAQRNVVLVYLFFDSPPCFPHAWIEVNDPALLCGRIVNFAGFKGDMVPHGKTGLCVEFFCASDNPILGLDDVEITALAMRECKSAKLVDEVKLQGSLVLRKRRTNAAASWREQQGHARAALLDNIKPIKSLYHVNRPGSDWASYAGLLAGRSIATNTRTEFDTLADPQKRLGEG